MIDSERRYSVFIATICVLFFLNNTTGFDFYAHSIAYYFNDQVVFQGNKLLGFILPRYLLLSYTYKFTSFLGLPLGYLAILLIFYPVYRTIMFLDRQQKIEITLLTIIFAYLSLFYSSFSVSLLWFSAYLFTRKNVFILGSIFSPFGLVVYFAYFALTFRFKQLVLLAVLLILFIAFNETLLFFLNENNSLIHELKPGNIRHEAGNISEIIKVTNAQSEVSVAIESLLHRVYEYSLYILQLKLPQFTVAGLLMLLSIISDRFSGALKSANNFTPDFIKYFLICLFLTLVCLIFYVLSLEGSPPNVYYALLNMEFSDTLRLSWLDFFSRDIHADPHRLLEIDRRLPR